MKEILIYMLGVAACSGLFVAFYHTVMHQRTSFRIARMFLVGSLVAAAVIPAFNIPVWESEPVVLPVFEITEYVPYEAEAPAVVKQTAPWQAALWSVYGVGIAALIGIMAFQAAKIHRMKRRAEVFAAGGYEVAVSKEVHAPFSFLQTVYVEQGTPADEMRQILLHETSHIRHRHSVEKISMETLKTLMWFNPFAWIASRLLNEVHEFEADRDVLHGGCTVEEYLPVIFRQVFGYIPEISTGLGNSLTKKRFEMMTKKLKHGRYSWLRTAGALPIAAGTLMLFGFTHRPPEIIMQKPDAQGDRGMIVTPNVKEEMNLSFDTLRLTNPKFADRNRKEITLQEFAELNPQYTVIQNGNEVILIKRSDVQKETIRFEPPKPPVQKDDAQKDDAQKEVIRFAPPVPPAQKDDAQKEIIIYQDGSAASKDEVVVVGYGTASKAGGAQIIVNDGKSNDNIFIWISGKNPHELTDGNINAIDPNMVKSVSVLKDGNYPEDIRIAIGDRKFDGVIIIEPKYPENLKGTVQNVTVTALNTTGKPAEITVTAVSDSNTAVRGAKPFIWLANEKREATSDELKTIEPNNIKSMSVLKDGNYPEEVRKAMGSRTFDGVIIIELKESKTTVITPVAVHSPTSEDERRAFDDAIVRELKGESQEPVDMTLLAGSKMFYLKDGNRVYWLLDEDRELSAEEAGRILRSETEKITVYQRKDIDSNKEVAKTITKYEKRVGKEIGQLYLVKLEKK